MLILAEGTIHRPVADPERSANAAWLGPMVDAGMLHSGYLDETGSRLIMILSVPDLAEARERLGDLPVVRDGSVTFETSRVTALRFS
jgi:hypothetical protein